jgi:hypothetical protein
MKDFKVTNVTYHRNGICGRQFHSVRFSYDNEGTPMDNMLAVFPVNARVAEGSVECYVIDLNNPTRNWRGDNFVHPVAAAVADFEAKGPERLAAAMDKLKSVLRKTKTP